MMKREELFMGLFRRDKQTKRDRWESYTEAIATEKQRWRDGVIER